MTVTNSISIDVPVLADGIAFYCAAFAAQVLNSYPPRPRSPQPTDWLEWSS